MKWLYKKREEEEKKKVEKEDAVDLGSIESPTIIIKCIIAIVIDSDGVSVIQPNWSSVTRLSFGGKALSSDPPQTAQR